MEARSATSVRHSSSMRWPTSVAGETTVPIWWILEVRRKQLDQLRDIADTDSDNDYDDDYAITRSEAVSFVIGGRGFVATGIRNSTSLSSDYWLYDPDKDLWYGDSDDDFTPITDVHNYPSGASSRRAAVGFSTGERGFVLTGTSGTSYFDDVYELLPMRKRKSDSPHN